MLMLEWLLVLCWILIGFVIARYVGVRGNLLAIVALPVGVSVTLAFALVQFVLPLPSWPLLALLGAIVVALLLLTLDVYRRTMSREWRSLLLASLVASVAVAIQLWLPLRNWSTDSLYYLEFSTQLATDNFSNGYLGEIEKRLLAVPVLHGFAIQLGVGDHLRTIGGLFALCILFLVWWLLRSRLRGSYRTAADVAGVAAALSLVTFNRFIFHTFYINSHLFVALIMLMIAGLLWARIVGFELGSSPDGLAIVATLVVPALVVSRAEGGLLALIIGIGFLTQASGRAPLVYMATAGASIAVWNFGMVLAAMSTDVEPSRSALLMLALGVATIPASVVILRMPAAWRSFLPFVFEASLWAFLLAMVIRDDEILLKSAQATFVNLAGFEGGWGVTGLIFVGLCVLAIAGYRCREDLILRLAVTTFVPLSFLLAYLREGAYRVGDGDSLNRMWMHLLPIALVFVVQRFALNRLRVPTYLSQKVTNSA
jgi:hypothetical protein